MFDYLEQFLKRPFRPEMDAWGWALFVLLLGIIAALWSSVIGLITKDT